MRRPAKGDGISHSIRPTDVGKRVTLQYFDASGERSEVVGLLQKVEMEADGPILHILRKDDSTVKVPLGKVRAGRVVR